MKTKILLGGIVAVGALAGTLAFAAPETFRAPVEFFRGHSHDDEGTHGAPAHGGGLDRYGCHNASVPYHCHR